MRVIFAGTSEFAAPSLEHLIASAHEVAAVITQTDKPSGRGRSVHISQVKQIARAHALPVLQPEKIASPEAIAEIKSHGPVGAMIVIAYGQKIPPDILNWPPHGVINVHGSILPKYRGAAPVQHALIAGEKQTGVTTMLMDEGWDTGDILLQEAIDIYPQENAGELSERLALLGARLLIRTLEGVEEGSISPIPQDNELATFARSLPPDAGAVDWTRAASDIVNLIRGCTPRPGAFTKRDGAAIKIWKASVAAPEGRFGDPGELVEITPDALVVAAGSGTVKLIEVQPESRKRMPASDYARGLRLSTGLRFDPRS